MSTVANFYDRLAAEYHLAYDDWAAAVRHHGQSLARLLTTDRVARSHVLDCACGIGTQAIATRRGEFSQWKNLWEWLPR